MFYLLAIIVDFLFMILNGIAFKVIYDWYLLKIFELPSISVFHAIGILLIIYFSTAREKTEAITDKDEMKELLLKTSLDRIARFLVTVMIAWVFHFFVK